MPGAVWWVEGPDGVPRHGACGHASLEPRREPARLDTVYDLASLTKMLATAPLLVALEQQGRLELEAPLGRYLKQFERSPWAGVSLISLATHTSGLPAWRPLYLEGSTIDDYLRQIAGMRVAAEPGQALYSDLGFIALGAVIAAAADTDLPTLFRERIAAPLGRSTLGFATGAGRRDAAPTERGNAFERELAGSAGAGHAWRETLLRGEVHDANAHGLGGAAGHAGLFGTAEDLATVARELLRPGGLGLDDRARDRLLRVQSGGRTVGMVSARCSRAARGVLPDEAPGHVGFTGTSLWLDPASGGFYALLTHRVHPQVGTRDFQLLRRGFHRLAALSPAGSGSVGGRDPQARRPQSR